MPSISAQMFKLRIVLFACTLGCWYSSAQDNSLPRDSAELIRKLDEFAQQERAKTESAITEKSKAVTTLLQQQMVRETQQGNRDAVSAIRTQLEKMGVAVTEAPPTSPPKAGRRMRIPKDARVFLGHSYQIIPYTELDEDERNWTGAKQACEKLGGHLAIIDSGAEHEFTCSLAPETHLWLGASILPKGKATSKWYWVDGSRVSQAYGGARVGEEELIANSYLRLYRGSWGVYRVDSPFVTAFVCEWDDVRPEN